MSTFISYYYPTWISSRKTWVPSNDDKWQSSLFDVSLLTFNYLSHDIEKCTTSTLIRWKRHESNSIWLDLGST